MNIFDPEREKQIISEATKDMSTNEKKYTESFLHNLMDISKEVQSK
jgi:chorismate mutase